jgi:hypothetical protein
MLTSRLLTMPGHSVGFLVFIWNEGHRKFNRLKVSTGVQNSKLFSNKLVT